METSSKHLSIQTLQWIAREYHDMNGTHYETLDAPPTALEFSRIVNISRPVVIKGCSIPAMDRWTDDYLIERMGNRPISVAVTSNGRADAVTAGPYGKLYFAEPHTEQMTMSKFLSSLSKGNSIDGASENQVGHEEIQYLQSQNGNLYSETYFENANMNIETSEFDVLRLDVPAEISWCSEALGKHPDAVNIWIGDSRSITSIHNDPYENIYTVIKGTKHFTLLPPTEGWCLQECMYPHAKYTRISAESHAPLSLAPSPPSTSQIRWSSIANPDIPGNLPPEAHPMRISVRAGERLYLPAGWWHHVRQNGDDDSSHKTIAANWWYDMEGRGANWVWLGMLRAPEVPDGNAHEAVAYHDTNAMYIT